MGHVWAEKVVKICAFWWHFTVASLREKKHFIDCLSVLFQRPSARTSDTLTCFNGRKLICWCLVEIRIKKKICYIKSPDRFDPFSYLAAKNLEWIDSCLQYCGGSHRLWAQFPFQAEDFYRWYRENHARNIKESQHIFMLCVDEPALNNISGPTPCKGRRLSGERAAKTVHFNQLIWTLREAVQPKWIAFLTSLPNFGAKEKHDKLQRGGSLWIYGLPYAASFAGQFFGCPQVVQWLSNRI